MRVCEWRDKEPQGGGGIKRKEIGKVAALKNIWESSGSGEKNAGLS